MARDNTASHRRQRAAASLRAMQGAVFTLTGDKRLIKNLSKIRGSIARKAMRKGLGKAVRIIVKAMKAAVPADQKGIKTAIGGRVGKAKGGAERGQFAAKAGAGVGKAYQKVANRKSGKKGVGISGRNVHWWIMGTTDRQNSYGSTGRMPPQAPEVIKQGFNASASGAADVIRKTIAEELAKVR